jgi:hypothetical protein
MTHVGAEKIATPNAVAPTNAPHVGVLAIDGQISVNTCEPAEVSQIPAFPIEGDNLIGGLNPLNRNWDFIPSIHDEGALLDGVYSNNILASVNHQRRLHSGKSPYVNPLSQS